MDNAIGGKSDMFAQEIQVLKTWRVRRKLRRSGPQRGRATRGRRLAKKKGGKGLDVA